MFLIFEDREIINLDNVATIEAEQNSDDKVDVVILTTAIMFYNDPFSPVPEHYNSYNKNFIIKKEKWFELLDALKQGQCAFVLNTEELNT